LFGGKSELGRVTERWRRRGGLRLKTEMQVTGLSCDDSLEWEGWKTGLERKLGCENVLLLLEYTAQKI
jgi:hypothetical protein